MRVVVHHYTLGTKARAVGFFEPPTGLLHFKQGDWVLVLDHQATVSDLYIDIRVRAGMDPLIPRGIDEPVAEDLDGPAMKQPAHVGMAGGFWRSAVSTEMERLGIRLTERSRVLRMERNGVPVEPHHLVGLYDPLTEDVSIWARDEAEVFVDVFCKPGVTDAEGEMASLALSHAGLPNVSCHAGFRYRFASTVPVEGREAASRLLGNPLIHQFIWYDEEEMPDRNEAGPAPEPVQIIAVRDAGDDELLTISRRFSLALDLEEMRTISAYFRTLHREPTDVELESIALTWSEHCSHKTFKATISFDHDGQMKTIHGLLQECIVAPTAQLGRPWVRSEFTDNAGVIAFDKDHDLAFKVETHNHPSALEPYGGSHTGIGGVIRDVLAVSAEPIGNTDVLCFGPTDLTEDAVPAGAFHPARTYREVVRGVADYGNNMGIPTVGGAVIFHEGYTANPLVFCGTLGLAPRGGHPREPRGGDAIVLLGGRTGRDGLHGATMSSEILDRETVASSTVQIGAPITEKLLRDVLPRLRDERLYNAITDCGAGGLCSAVGEMGETLGIDVDLARVPLKYQGLRPWEIWLSEAQERMVLAVPDEALPRLHEICDGLDVEATVIGTFPGDGVMRLRHSGEGAVLGLQSVVAELHMRFMHQGRPRRTLRACWRSPPVTPYRSGDPENAAHSLLGLLSHPNIASKEGVIRRYDHEVGAATVLKPLTGNGGPSDATILRPTGSWRGVVVSHGINPLYGRSDPYAMAILAVDEALRNLTAVGGSIDRAALLDNFCWGDVDDPTELGALVRAAQGCRDAALAYGVPFICGKDSLRNTSVDPSGKHSIPGTLLISAVSVIPDLRRTITMDLKRQGSRIYLLGMTRDELCGSHYLGIRGLDGGCVPSPKPEEAAETMRRLTRAIRRGLCLSCHDLSEGGLAVAAAEMAIAGDLGLEIDLTRVESETDAVEALLFGESAGRFLVEVAPEDEERFVTAMGDAIPRPQGGVVHGCVGKVVANGRFVVRRVALGPRSRPSDPRWDGAEEMLIDLGVEELEKAWKPFDSSSASSLREEKPASPTVWTETPPSPAPVRYGATVVLRGKPRAMVLTAAGVNCDKETVEACRLAGAEVEPVHVNRLIEGERFLRDFGMLVIPGGFSYGDHLGAGAMLASVLRHRFLDQLWQMVDDGRPVLGICNGFQVLARLGLLGDVSLIANRTGVFECRWVPLRVQVGVNGAAMELDGPVLEQPTHRSIRSAGEPVRAERRLVASPCLFLGGLEEMELPIAHGEGRVVAPHDALPELLTRAPLRYVDNPNGSVADIAGVCNAQGNVFGMMPHPERFVTIWQHPRRNATRPPAGLRIFENAVRHTREGL